MRTVALVAAALAIGSAGAGAQERREPAGFTEDWTPDAPLAGSWSDARLHGSAFRRAVALDEAGRPAEVLAALEGLEVALPELADRIRFLRGRALEALGRPADAAAAYAEVPDGSLRGPQARLARARLLARAGRAGEALAAIEPLLGAPPPPEVGLPDHAAAALLAEGRIRAAARPADLAGAREAFLECWAAHPLAWESRVCLAALRALPGVHSAGPDAAWGARRAGALLDVGRVPAAVAQLRPYERVLPAAGPDQPVACRVRAALGRAALLRRRRADAVAMLRPVAERCADGEVRAAALRAMGDALSARGRRDEAVATFQQLAREHAGSPLVPEALFAAGELLARGGRLGEAVRSYAAAALEVPDSDLGYEASFRAAWLTRKLGDADGAISQLLAIEARARGRRAYDEARAGYWRARLLAPRGEGGREAARAIWTDVATRFPAEYYGLAARDRLQEPAPASTGSVSGGAPASSAGASSRPPPERDLGELARDRHLRAGLALLALGLRGAAIEELHAIDGSRLGGHDGDPVLVVAELLARAGARASASMLLREAGLEALRAPPEGQELPLWRIAYPGSYRAEVARWARTARVPPDLLHALLREESSLDPRAVSPVGAIGLSQLMLPTARQLAHQLGLGPVTRAQLRVPSVSIRLGGRYLGTLLRRFDGSFALALAAYNAGPAAVARWQREHAGGEVDELVEEIPFAETQAFVKRVLRSFAAYRLLYGVRSAANGPRLPAPEPAAQPSPHAGGRGPHPATLRSHGP